MESLLSAVSDNQRKLICALLDHPEGLMSNQLAELTAVSNKSATMSQEVRELLEQHGLELTIERREGRALWVIKEVPTEITIPRKKLIKLRDCFNQVSKSLDEIRQILG